MEPNYPKIIPPPKLSTGTMLFIDPGDCMNVKKGAPGHIECLAFDVRTSGHYAGKALFVTRGFTPHIGVDDDGLVVIIFTRNA
jgi:hypothetical protein